MQRSSILELLPPLFWTSAFLPVRRVRRVHRGLKGRREVDSDSVIFHRLPLFLRATFSGAIRRIKPKSSSQCRTS